MRLMRLVAESGALTQHPLLARDIVTYHLAEDVSELLIYFVLVFSPWAFGTTEPWSLWTMRSCGYCLGLLLRIKLFLRGVKGYRPARWEEGRKAEKRKAESAKAERRESKRNGLEVRGSTEQDWVAGSWVVRPLAVLTLCILLYCLVAALNARAAFDSVSRTFEYHSFLHWLPHSFDSRSTWDAFWNYLSLAGCFWAIRDWLLGKSTAEARADSAISPRHGRSRPSGLPARLRRLLWVLCLSGALLGLEGIVQRVSNCPKLLFLVTPEIHQTAETQFASYAYRANGAQYFNLLWPVCLGFWWTLVRSAPEPGIARLLPLVCASVMAVCPLVSGARGAALVDLAMLAAAMPVLLAGAAPRRDHPGSTEESVTCATNVSCPGFSLSPSEGERAGVRGPSVCSPSHSPPSKPVNSIPLLVLFFLGVLAVGLGLGWRQLLPRLNRLQLDFLQREQLYDSARRIAQDYPVFGAGPGAFERVFQLYRPSAEAYWPAQLHNDWLETRVTFGWAGSALIALAALAVPLRWLRAPSGIPCEGRFVFLFGLSLAGCLVQARWDFPCRFTRSCCCSWPGAPCSFPSRANRPFAPEPCRALRSLVRSLPPRSSSQGRIPARRLAVFASWR